MCFACARGSFIQRAEIMNPLSVCGVIVTPLWFYIHRQIYVISVP